MTFRRLLSLRLKSLDAAGDIRPITNGLRLGGEAYVLSRALCGFERRAMTRSDAKGRKAIFLAIKRESGDANADAWIERGSAGTDANTWRWNGAAVAAALGGVKSPPIIPETLARVPGAHGLRLARCIDGYEGEFWVQGELMASRWWPRPPDAASWAVFVRSSRAADLLGAGADETRPPQPETIPWRDDLTALDGDLAVRQPLLRPAALGKWLFIIIAPFILFEHAKAFSQGSNISRLENYIAGERDASAEFLRARSFARREQGRVRNAQTLGDETELLAALAALAPFLKDTKVVISGITLRDGVMVVTLANNDGVVNAALIAKLEKSPYWRNVSLQNSPFGITTIRGEVFGWISKAPQS